MRIRGPFCALIEMGPRPFRGKPKTDKMKTLSQFGRLMDPVI